MNADLALFWKFSFENLHIAFKESLGKFRYLIVEKLFIAINICKMLQNQNMRYLTEGIFLEI